MIYECINILYTPSLYTFSLTCTPDSYNEQKTTQTLFNYWIDLNIPNTVMIFTFGSLHLLNGYEISVFETDCGGHLTIILLTNICLHLNEWQLDWINIKRDIWIWYHSNNALIKGILWDRRWRAPSIGVCSQTCWFVYRNAFLIMKLRKLPSFRMHRALIASQSTFKI